MEVMEITVVELEWIVEEWTAEEWTVEEWTVEWTAEEWTAEEWTAEEWTAEEWTVEWTVEWTMVQGGPTVLAVMAVMETMWVGGTVVVAEWRHSKWQLDNENWIVSLLLNVNEMQC